MAKTKRLLLENLKLVDVVIELLDARIPRSSKNPEIDALLNTKPKIIVLNKSDLSDKSVLQVWEKYYNQQNIPYSFVDSLKGTAINLVKAKLKSLMKNKIEMQKKKGRIFVPIRTMVVGIPNVGKSSFINKIAGRSCAVTGDRPGVTRGKQWVKLDKDFDLLDTPGILWPKFEDPQVALNLAFTGAIKDDLFDKTEVACALIERLCLLYPENIMDRYKLTSIESKTGFELLNIIGKNRGSIISGGNVDFEKISSILLDEFRGGKLGKITLETPINNLASEDLHD